MDRQLYRAHYKGLIEFTQTLRDRRCIPSGNFGPRVVTTMGVFDPLVSPWSLEIIFGLYMHGATRFNALKRLLAPISSRVLSDKLTDLVRQGLVVAAKPNEPLGYGLTARGEVVARHLHPLVFFLHTGG